jgi:hypothetical protein
LEVPEAVLVIKEVKENEMANGSSTLGITADDLAAFLLLHIDAEQVCYLTELVRIGSVRTYRDGGQRFRCLLWDAHLTNLQFSAVATYGRPG